MRLNKKLRELNINLDTAIEFLTLAGLEVEARPTYKLSEEEVYALDQYRKVAELALELSLNSRLDGNYEQPLAVWLKVAMKTNQIKLTKS